ncbi:MAG: AEC family transporter, partial [Candidatus Competibacteraceae bacterium]|nr:AEC family transporter [Candidatus Competibacteraceae bacterium]
MPTSLPLILSALGPIFGVIALGYALRRRGFPGEAFWPLAEKLTYFLLFPALLVRNLAAAQLGGLAVGGMSLAIVLLLGTMTLLLFALRPWLGTDGPGFSSVYQGGIRFNTYVGLAAATALFGPPGATLAALAIALLIPLVNVLCVAVITHSVGGREASPRAMLRA